MPERKYLAIVNVHSNFHIVDGPELIWIKNKVNTILEKPKQDYPNHDFNNDIEIYNVRPLRRKERKIWQNANSDSR